MTVASFERGSDEREPEINRVIWSYRGPEKRLTRVQ